MGPSKSFVICLLATVTLIGAKPPPKPTTNNPQIGYVNISGGTRRLYQLRVANEDGTGAATLYSSRDVGQMVPHMGPAADRTILLVQGSNLSLVRYETSSTGTKFTSIEALPSIGSSVGAQQVDFSPDGNYFVSFSRLDNKLWTFNLDSRAFQPLLQLESEPHSFAFSRDSAGVLYLDHVSDTDAILKRIPLSGGAPVSLGIRGDYWDVEAAHQSDAYVLVRGVDIVTSRIEFHPAGGAAPIDLAQGYAPSIKCDDSSVIYQQVQPDQSVKLLRVALPSKAGSTTSSSGNYWPDYVGC